MKNWMFALTLLAVILLSSCSQTEVRDFFVDKSLTSNCPIPGFGMPAPATCLNVKFNKTDSYEGFSNEIEGFTYEEGFFYELRVQVTPPNANLADDIATYDLLNIVSKEKAD